jgi:hypothetical protein
MGMPIMPQTARFLGISASANSDTIFDASAPPPPPLSSTACSAPSTGGGDDAVDYAGEDYGGDEDFGDDDDGGGYADGDEPQSPKNLKS